MKVAEKFGRKRQLPEKNFFQKTSKKYLTNGKRRDIIIKLSTESDSNESLRAKRFDIKET